MSISLLFSFLLLLRNHLLTPPPHTSSPSTLPRHCPRHRPRRVRVFSLSSCGRNSYQARNNVQFVSHRMEKSTGQCTFCTAHLHARALYTLYYLLVCNSDADDRLSLLLFLSLFSSSFSFFFFFYYTCARSLFLCRFKVVVSCLLYKPLSMKSFVAILVATVRMSFSFFFS